MVYHLELTLLQKFLTSQDSSVTLQKAQWRCRALEKVSDAMIRRKTAKALIPDKMSSEEKEHGNVKQNFEQKIPSFWDKKSQKLIVNVTNATYIKNISKQ